MPLFINKTFCANLANPLNLNRSDPEIPSNHTKGNHIYFRLETAAEKPAD